MPFFISVAISRRYEILIFGTAALNGPANKRVNNKYGNCQVTIDFTKDPSQKARFV